MARLLATAHSSQRHSPVPSTAQRRCWWPRRTQSSARCGSTSTASPDFAALWALRVKPAWWGRGIATALLTTAEQLVTARALSWTTIEVRRDNLRARTLFERRGYELARVRGANCLVLRKRITHADTHTQPSC